MFDSSEEYYKNPGKQAPIGLMASRGVFNDGNTSDWEDKKQFSFPSLTYSDNTNWDTIAACMSVA